MATIAVAPSFAPPHVELHLPAILRLKLNRGELPYDPLSLPDLFLNRIRGRRCRIVAAPPRTRHPSRAHAASPPCASPCAAAARPRAA